MTPATQLLKKHQASFELLSYEHDANAKSFGLEAVEKLDLPAEQVFKTLVLETNAQQLIVAVIPVTRQVNMKLLAKACGAKKVQMAAAQKVENSTGYILGGVSPLGQKKRLTTYLHKSAAEFTTIYVSAGKRGLEISLRPTDLVSLCNAKLAEF
ncbi:MAG: Cys-tRNA(Pro) deacylase [Pseudoalteromonas sp.]|uniref:Cys-tRNA(Pro)/Cys-tRNA(Cys) deacylase n=1 Tax=Pseudoalteromonas prydzensis TaxID=182141 RepID=A0ABR9FKB3_9GAMM|nr:MULTISPECIES: Cys-tRNA(Pro) deacylase [Pseudoalteromonas]MBE0457260.1 Cys-tRNA(Pro) deacylase [Pseudoalteromonas prydzensis]WKD26077.1 Cys-tRNA(Pro) deacylase [Pseudoalteromonas sp. KG3]